LRLHNNHGHGAFEPEKVFDLRASEECPDTKPRLYTDFRCPKPRYSRHFGKSKCLWDRGFRRESCRTGCHVQSNCTRTAAPLRLSRLQWRLSHHYLHLRRVREYLTANQSNSGWPGGGGGSWSYRVLGARVDMRVSQRVLIPLLCACVRTAHTKDVHTLSLPKFLKGYDSCYC